MIRRTYKYKLYKTKRLKHLNEIIDISALIYNHCIALHKRYYKMYHKYLNANKLKKHLTKLKRTKRYQFWSNVPSQAIQDIAERIDRSYKLFFRNVKHKVKTSPPKFRKVKSYKSYTLKQAGYKIVDNTIYLSGHKYKFWLSRPIEGEIKTVTVKRDSIGDFYICLSVKQDKDKANVTSGKIVGIDFGLKTFLTLSDNTEIESPRFFENNIKDLKKLQRKLSKKVKGSNNYKMAKRRLAKLHIKISNRRRDYFHKLANKLADKYDYIAIEDLNMKAMQKLWGRKISDYAFSEFISILSYKANVVKINKFFPSSKTCSKCGHVLDTLDTKTREWTCPVCGTKHNRDLNASINICRVGISTLSIDGVKPQIAEVTIALKPESL